MEIYSDETYGEKIAGVYDQLYPDIDPTAVKLLAELAGGGKALELGIGTGRVAIPLSQAGVDVSGVDASPSMVERLHARAGGEHIRVTIGDFSAVPVEGQYDLIYVVFNTIFALLTQEDQLRCFQNVARHLTPRGVFVIEAFVPDLARFTAGQAVRAVHVGLDEVRLDVSEIEVDQQVITSQHLVFSAQGNHLYPVKIRYVWPSEMDLMARLAQLQRKERWCDWHKGAFTAQSTKHISIYAHAR